MMYDANKLRAELIIHEGKRLDAYQDSLGFWTIGIGHCLGKQKWMAQINEKQCQILFDEDLQKAEENLDRIIPFWRELDDVRQRVLMNMSFNLGGNLKKFQNFKEALAHRDFERAATNMLNSRWAKQVGNRATYLAALMNPTQG